MTTEELAKLAGTDAYKGGHAGAGYYDTITLGKDGKFYIAYYSQPKAERQDAEALGKSIDVTFLKIRSKLTRWEDSVQTLTSVEYDAGDNLIPTTQGDLTEADAKKMGAKKALVVYGLYKDKPVKLTVSGGSLYNPDDEENLRLYSYLQSFEGDEHTFMSVTKIKAIENEYEWDGETKKNYHMSFAKGKDSDLKVVGVALKQLVEDLVENDARDLKYLGSEKKAEAQYNGTDEATADESDDEDPPF